MQETIEGSSRLDKIARYEISLDGGYGVFLAHRHIMRQLVTGHPYQFSVKLAKRSKIEEYRNPFVGLKASWYYNFSNDVIGYAIAIMPCIDFPLNGENEKWVLSIGSGAVFIQKPFSQQYNHKNIAIGSGLNGAVNLDIKRLFHTSFGTFYLGGGLMHFSNSAFQAPNLGLNFFTLNAGISIRKGESEITTPKPKPTFEKKNHWQVMAIGSLKSVELIHRTKLGIWGLNGEYQRHFSPKGSWLMGADITYNNTLRHTMDNYEKDMDILQLGIYGGYQLNIEKLQLLSTMGVYVRNKAPELGLFYHRLSFRYSLNKHIALHAGIRSHLDVADFLETGLIYRIK